MALNSKALEGYDPEKVFPADKYQAEIKKTTIKRDENEGIESITIVVVITDYKGKKSGGEGAIGTEFVAYIGDIENTEMKFLKDKYLLLYSTLLKACDVSPEDDVDEDTFNGQIVYVALDTAKDKFKKNTNVIAFFEKA